MKIVNLVLTTCLGVSLISCAAMGFTDDQQKLIQTVSFDQNCPKEKITVENRLPAGNGVTKYQMKVCGKKMRYVRLGTSYFEESKSPMAGR